MSESKFRAHPADFIPHIVNPNRAALEALITKPAVEKALLERLVKKAKLYGRDIGPDGEPREDWWKIDVPTVKDLYEQYIIPLTKEVEVRMCHPRALCADPRGRRSSTSSAAWMGSRRRRSTRLLPRACRATTTRTARMP